MKMRIHKNDLVLVLCGKNRGKRGKIIAVNPVAGKVKVEGVNLVRKAVRRSRRNPQGGLLTMEMPLPVSNVELICPVCDKPTRIGIVVDDKSVKSRVCKKCGAVIGVVSSAK